MHLFESDQKTQHVSGEEAGGGGGQAKLQSAILAVETGPCHPQCQLGVAHPPTN